MEPILCVRNCTGLNEEKIYIRQSFSPPVVHSIERLVLKKKKKLYIYKITLTIIRLPIVILNIMLPSILFPTPNQMINNYIFSIQQWLVQLTSKQIMTIHNYKGQSWSLIIISLIFIGSTNLLGLFTHYFELIPQLSINLNVVIPLWAGTIITSFHHKTKEFLAHFYHKIHQSPLSPC